MFVMFLNAFLCL